MAIRTVQLLGMAFGPDPVTVTATANGTQVFSGTVTTIDQPVPVLPNLDLTVDQVPLITFEIDTAFTGQIPMTCVVAGGTVIFGEIFANYVSIPNPVYSQAQLDILSNPASTRADKIPVWTAVANPPFSTEELATLENPATTSATVQQIIDAHNCAGTISSGSNEYQSIDNTDARSNVVIDGVPQTPEHGDLPGSWWWTIGDGSTIAYNLDVDPALV